ncbi:unnamed protein product [Ceratitis capitata]|uniref:(Mediterranean fruit fly) hypothetical protein n=1 Tax=Ceratitis capitata TaxID=7213 RepID=A0A811U8M5_CERCA|nr:unnamed protein product [Ceratitis capitata]
MFGFCEQPCATNRALNFSISPDGLRFTVNTHLHPMTFLCFGLSTNTQVPFFVSESNSDFIAAFQCSRSFEVNASFTVCGFSPTKFNTSASLYCFFGRPIPPSRINFGLPRPLFRATTGSLSSSNEYTSSSSSPFSSSSSTTPASPLPTLTSSIELDKTFRS